MGNVCEKGRSTNLSKSTYHDGDRLVLFYMGFPLDGLSDCTFEISEMVWWCSS